MTRGAASLWRRVVALPLLLVHAGLVHEAAAQNADSPDRADLAQLLADVRDLTPNFDEPAFYALLDLAAAESVASSQSAAARSPSPEIPWTFLTERPTQYRGRRITIEGVVESSIACDITPGNTGPSDHSHRVIQTELSVYREARLITLVTVGDSDPAPIHDCVRATGWFLKVRQFRTASGGWSYAPLIVAPRWERISCVEFAGPKKARGPSGGRVGNITIAISVLLVAWWVLRRWSASSRPAASAGPSSPASRSQGQPPPAATDEDFDWLLNPAPRNDADSDKDSR